MRKEIVFALLAGIAFGLVIAFGVWKSNSSQEKTKQNQETNSQSNQITPTSLPESGLTILKPEEYEVVNTNTINIEGITEAEAQIVVSSEEKDFLIKADKDGGFNLDIPLISGLNEIVVTSFLKNGKNAVIKLPIVYSQDFQK